MSSDITSYRDYNKIYTNKYTISEIKHIGILFHTKWHNKKKNELKEECYLFLKKGFFVSKIQKLWKKYLIKLFNKSQGPAKFNRTLCNNVEDFLTTETMKEIDYYFFISYKDIDGFVYGFNIISLFNLIQKKDLKNPYTRNIFSPELILLVEERISYNKLLNKTYHEINDLFYKKMTIDDNLFQLFQKIDSLGNYTQCEWLINLSPYYMRRFILELYDIWNYRAQILNETKLLICPSNTPFHNIPITIIGSTMYIDNKIIKQYCFNIINNLINSAVLPQNQNLGCIYVLTALTLVNSEAANALPWLFQSVI